MGKEEGMGLGGVGGGVNMIKTLYEILNEIIRLIKKEQNKIK